jgi:hypothetical protein
MLPPFAKDLIVVTADSQMHLTVEALLNHRRRSLAVADFSVDVVTHPNQDPGCRTDAGRLLNPRRQSHGKAMVLFDFDGCGERHLSPQDLETSLETQFANQGWGSDRVTFVVIEPELEAWLFGASFRQIERAVGWSETQSIRGWLIERGYLTPGSSKPCNPKAAIESVLYQQKHPRSGRLFADLARTVGLPRCRDRAFQKFRSTLQRWFPAE